MDFLVNKGIGNTNSNIWLLEFLRDIKKFDFEDYCGLYFNRISKFYCL